MKSFLRVIFFNLIFVFSFFCCASAADLGMVKETDIVAFIDYSPILSFNYKGNTFVIAEDLANYGFSVEWNNDERALNITRNERSFTPYVADFINQMKEEVTFKDLYKVHPTDIKTYINGKLSESYNIYGTTVVSADALGEYGGGFVKYDDEKRRLDICMLEKEVEGKEKKTRDDGATEIGFFDDEGVLCYGIFESTAQSKYGSSTTKIIGNFEKGKTITITNSYIYQNMPKYEFDGVENYSADIISSDEKLPSYTHHYSQNGKVYLEFDERFKYSMRVRYALFEDGSAARYLPKTGKIYLMSEKENNSYENASAVFDDEGNEIYNCETYPRSFNGTIFKDGYPVYNGKIYLDRFELEDKYSGVQKTVALYAPGYTDDDGVIYYYSNYTENIDEYDSVLYRGNVVNGVMHGEGVMYYRSYGNSCYDEGREIKIYGIGREPKCMNAVDESIMYIGSFKDGLTDGYGKLYCDGALKSEGFWKKGKRNGYVTDYEAHTDEIYLNFEGIYENGIKNGEGIEYAPKGNPLFEGMYKKFTGIYENGEKITGEEYDIKYNAEKNCHDVYLLKTY